MKKKSYRKLLLARRRPLPEIGQKIVFEETTYYVWQAEYDAHFYLAQVKPPKYKAFPYYAHIPRGSQVYRLTREGNIKYNNKKLGNIYET